jgi:hypothetical protein
LDGREREGVDALDDADGGSATDGVAVLGRKARGALSFLWFDCQI